MCAYFTNKILKWWIIILIKKMVIREVILRKVKHSQLLWLSFKEPSTQQFCSFLLMFMYYMFYTNLMFDLYHIVYITRTNHLTLFWLLSKIICLVRLLTKTLCWNNYELRHLQLAWITIPWQPLALVNLQII